MLVIVNSEAFIILHISCILLLRIYPNVYANDIAKYMYSHTNCKRLTSFQAVFIEQEL